jgi:hypothetical protein
MQCRKAAHGKKVGKIIPKGWLLASSTSFFAYLGWFIYLAASMKNQKIFFPLAKNKHFS